MKKECMKKEYDFSKGKRVSPDKVDRDIKIMISLRTDPRIISLLKDEADRLGMPYQTLINSILHRFVNGELIDKKEAKKIVS